MAYVQILRRVRKLAVLSCVASVSLFVGPRAHAQEVQVPQQLTLAAALEISRTNNPQLAELRALADAADADRVSAGRRPNPAFSFDAEGYPLFSSGRPSFLNGQELTFRFDQELELAGRRRLRLGVADSAAAAAKLDIDARARIVELEVKRAYFEAVLAQEDRAVAQASLQELDQVIALNQRRLDVGEVSGAELRRVKVERLRFVDDVFTAELALKNAKSALLALLGVSTLNQPLELAESLAATAGGAPEPAIAAGPGPALQVVMSEALSRRADVGAARQGVAQFETETRLQRALRTPNVTFGGGYRRDLGANTVVFGVTVPLPLFNRNQGGVLRADAEHRAAIARANTAELLARLEIQQALNAVEANQARVEYIEREHLKNARESVDLTLAAYKLGEGNLIDFLDAQRSFRETQRIYNRALFDQRISRFELAIALGRSDVR